MTNNNNARVNPYKNITPEMKKGQMEAMWRRRERQQLRNEVVSLFRRGRIVHQSRLKPQMLVKDENGRWCPEVVVRKGL